VSALAGKMAGVAETIVLLHGFAGTHRTWDPVIARLDPERYRPLALDLPAERLAVCAARVLALAPPRFALCGYSMGGRLAQHVALAAPERVTHLVLVSTTAGISDDAERAERRAADEALAARIEAGTIDAFADEWGGQPLFAGDPARVRALAREDYLRHDPRELAAMLRAAGTGVMAPLWHRLRALTMPATVVAGERDTKYVALAERLAAALPDARLVVIPGAGHALHLEAPDELARSLDRPG
jgi:2-succinyl-6-hydroxy-2,4-cyclohexadiene-1-carboxylate synthase